VAEKLLHYGEGYALITIKLKHQNIFAVKYNSDESLRIRSRNSFQTMQTYLKHA
jgi:hypothetical protein